MEHFLSPGTVLGSLHALFDCILSTSLEVSALTVPILKIRKLTFRKEKLRGLPKITQLTSVELRFEPDRLNTKAHSRNHSFQRKEVGGGGWI